MSYAGLSADSWLRFCVRGLAAVILGGMESQAVYGDEKINELMA